MARDPVTAYGESLSFLLSQVGARSATRFRERLATLGVTPRDFGVLSNLEARGPQSQQKLADALGIHRNNMVGLIDAMEERGWVERRRSEVDRRVFEIHVTAAGRRTVRKANSVVPELDDELGRSLDEGERELLVRMLGDVAVDLGLMPAVHPSLARR